MAAGATPINISKTSQEGLVKFAQQTRNMLVGIYDIRPQLLARDIAYARTGDQTEANVRARVANALGDKKKIQNVQVPIIAPQVEGALSFLVEVFCGQFPMFPISSGPQNIDAANQMETVLANQQVEGGWVREFTMAFRDGLKYNMFALEVDWRRKNTYTVETDLQFDPKLGKPKETIWEGNTIRRMDLYNTIFDMRVPPSQIHSKGDYAGYLELLTRVQLKQFINNLPEKFIDNIKPAFESGAAVSGGSPYAGYYLPEINPDALIHMNPRVTTNWLAWASLEAQQGIRYGNMYELLTLYARIIPSDFSLRVPGSNTPQIWRLYVINNQYIIFAERMTNAHGFLPIVFGQPIEDGLQYQTKSFQDNLLPFQDMATALWAERLSSARRRLTDRMLYDASRIRINDINNPASNAKIPVKNSAYGKDLKEAVYPIPFNDGNVALFSQEAGAMVEFASQASGRNKPKQGQFQKGNKTAEEFNTVMANADDQDKLKARFLEDQVMMPIKTMLKLNILQYQPSGEVYNPNTAQTVQVDPVTLRTTAMEFKVGDGLLPTEKLMGAEDFAVGLQTIQSVPKLQSEYDVSGAFAYLMKQRGANDLKDFKLTPEQIQQGQEQQTDMAEKQVKLEIVKEALIQMAKLGTFKESDLAMVDRVLEEPAKEESNDGQQQPPQQQQLPM